MYMLPARSSFSCLLLCACSGASALVLPPRAPGVVAQHSPLRAAAAAPSRHAAPVAAEERRGGLPFFLDIGTKGGIVFYSVIGIVAPFLLYNFLQDQMGMDVVGAGNVILVGYVGLGTVAWTSTYVFRVANKDMTYAKQLRDYENAVIQKRFEELDNDEVSALMDEIYTDGSRKPTQADGSTPPA
ncbi:hypothetical protein EMIHUDRAFT_427662 [Emiliania huxleyi CCMP1516]|uniref:Uncharacterized protein n=3 Tax=Emiliania huxleyi TaxID=2903 RepID=A0A0D3IVV4_EMIH1|nr:hypothetical protein EMIHUDRAFT_427662 [Emiliania huxleyi CCMP1516]EOD15389.1 hypothetical protein EMIHUDRAFT_427662 [Emiliania huxleyi CCMP1516]|eukprot:XP_005767818.1 hypothetical protein EMIHUDRAFT_427662 [Emiliania huxleyi CCMP1516]